MIRICEAISEMTGRDQTLLDQEMVVGQLNRTMIGWANYCCLGPVSNAYRAVERHARKRLRHNGCVPSTRGVAGVQTVSGGISARGARPCPPY